MLLLNDPLVAVTAGRSGGDLEPAGSFISVDRDHVMMSALKKAEDGDALIVRLYEGQNRRGRVNVCFFRPPVRAVECDMMENEIGDARLVSGRLRFDIKPYEIRTFKLFFD